MRSKPWPLLILLSLGAAARALAAPSCSELAAQLSDKNFEVRARAAAAIGEHCPRDVYVLELDKLLYDPAGSVRQAAAGALAKIPSVQAKKALQRAVGNDRADARREYVAGLAEAPDRHLDLLDGALEDEDQLVRERAVQALGEGSSAAVLLHLAKAVQRDQDVFVREQALEAIGSWFERARKGGPPPAIPREVMAALRAGLADESDRVRAQTVRAFERVDPEGAVAQVGKLLRDRSSAVRRAVFGLLGRLGGPRSVTHLEDAVSDGELAVRRLAVKALVQLGSAGVPGLLTATRDSSAEIRADALDGLPRPLPEEAIPAVSRLTSDDVDSIRRRAVEALGSVPSSEAAREAVVGALGDTDPTVRRAALETAAATFGEAFPETVETTLLMERDLVVKKVGLELVADVSTSAAANLLGEVLANASQGGFGEEALRLLLDHHRKFAAGPLSRALPLVDPALRKQIVEALGELGDPRVAEELMAILEDENESDHLRIAAATALSELGHAPALQPMQEMYIRGVHLSPAALRQLQRSMAQLGEPSVWPLLLRRHALKLAVAGLFVLGALLWHFWLGPRLAARDVERQQAYLARREQEAPRGPPTEDEFLQQLDEKLGAEPPRSREVKLLLQRGMLHFLRLDYDLAATDLESAARKFQDDDSQEQRALTHFFLAKAALKRGDKQYAQRQFSQALRYHDLRINQEVMSEIAQHQGPSDLDKNIRMLEEKLPFTDDISSVDVYKLS